MWLRRRPSAPAPYSGGATAPGDAGHAAHAARLPLKAVSRAVPGDQITHGTHISQFWLKLQGLHAGRSHRSAAVLRTPAEPTPVSGAQEGPSCFDVPTGGQEQAPAVAVRASASRV